MTRDELLEEVRRARGAAPGTLTQEYLDELLAETENLLADDQAAAVKWAVTCMTPGERILCRAVIAGVDDTTGKVNVSKHAPDSTPLGRNAIRICEAARVLQRTANASAGSRIFMAPGVKQRLLEELDAVLKGGTELR